MAEINSIVEQITHWGLSGIWKIVFALLIVLLYKAAVCGTVTDALAAAAAFTQFNVYAVVPAATLIFVEPSASLYPCAS